MTLRLPPPNSLVDALRRQAQARPGHPALVFLADGEAETARLDYRELDLRARRFAARLQQQGLAGQHVLLLLPSGVHYVVAFLGCLYAGAVPVPGYPPASAMHAQRMVHIAADCAARAAIVAAGGSSRFDELFARESRCPLLVVDDAGRLPEAAAGPVWHEPRAQAGDVAYLQYTSGSTSRPRGVVVTHGNLLAHAHSWRCDGALGPDDVFVSWLPLFHDMGLVLGVLQMLHDGGTVVLMPPLAFLQKPLRWLRAISRYRGTASYAPNFAYALCADALDAAPPGEALDLSCWAVAGNGAEPVQAQTLARFAERCAPFGLRAQALNPGYGLAEATLTVSRQPRGEPAPVLEVDADALGRGRLEDAAPAARRRTLVGCGRAWGDTQWRIVDAATGRPCAQREVGEVWVAGPVVARGYWQRPEASEQAFGARLADGSGPWLRTGDLGAAADGQLFITGRAKDVIVVRGSNHYPQDIEHTVAQAHAALAPGHGAAFAVDAGGQERVVVVQELRRTQRRHADGAQVVQAIRAAVAEAHGLQLHAVLLLQPASVHLTSSGKIQRQSCKASFLAGQFEPLHAWQASHDEAAPAPQAPARRDAGTIADWLAARIASLLALPAAQVDPQAPFTALGLDSLQMVTLSGDLAEWLARPVEPTLLYSHPDIARLSRHLAGGHEAPAVAAPAAPGDEPIAIVGVACRFPQADTPDALWRLLDGGVDAVGAVPASRGELACRWGGFLDGIDGFDAPFFGISPREADAMDPQQRLLLQSAWHALEDAGIAPDTLAGSDAGVFVGAMGNDYALLQRAAGVPPDAWYGTGTQSSVLANRLSYVFGLQGPSWTVETACSSSLVALHQARGSLLAGECGLALVGGVNLLLAPEPFVALSQAQMLSPDGRCRAFDARANGYVRAEGCAVLVLERLSDALRHRRRIHGLVRGSAVNQDGRSNGLTAPSGLAQQAVIRRALAAAGVAAHEVDCIEAHGTGTALGDPIEMDALQRTYGAPSPAHPAAWVGSVKSNIGHAEPVAGLAGLVKLLLALRHERIPRTLHCERLNPRLPLEAGRCRVATEAQPWPRRATPRLAALSSFGFGGTNAHVVLQEAPVSDTPPQAAPRMELLTLSARSPSALRELARGVAAQLDDEGVALHAVCHTANAHRARLPHRLALAGRTPGEMAVALRQFADGEASASLLSAHAPAPATGRTAFLFTGQGVQARGMGQGLYRTQRTFRDTMDRCDEILRPLLGASLVRGLYGRDDDALDLSRTELAQPALFALEYALAQSWQSIGVRPDAVLGHSLGEYVAACIAGVFGLEDALRLVAQRGRLMQLQTPRGHMIAVQAPAALLDRLLAELAARPQPDVALAARNAADSAVLSGAPASVQRLAAQWARQGAETTALQVTRAFHSPLMREMLASFERCARQLRFAPPRLPLVSNLSGRVAGDEVTDPMYWVDHVCRPVEFLAGLRTLGELGCTRFVEAGPHPVLCSFGRQTLQGGLWLPSLRRGADDEQQWLASLGEWTLAGGSVDWAAWASAGSGGGTPPAPVALPPYPFRAERHWFGRAAAEAEPAHDDTPATAPCPREIAALPAEAAQQRLVAYLQQLAFRVLRLNARQRDEIGSGFAQLPLNQLGFDSLMAVELRNRVLVELGAELPLSHLLAGATAADAAALLYRLLAVQQLSRAPADAGEPEPTEELVL